jgi:hypothetical protein
MWSGQELCSNLVICEFLSAESGLKFSFDVKTTLNISDITFYPSQTTHGYDLYASAMEKEDILFLNLLTGKQTCAASGDGTAARRTSRDCPDSSLLYNSVMATARQMQRCAEQVVTDVAPSWGHPSYCVSFI